MKRWIYISRIVIFFLIRVTQKYYFLRMKIKSLAPIKRKKASDWLLTEINFYLIYFSIFYSLSQGQEIWFWRRSWLMYVLSSLGVWTQHWQVQWRNLDGLIVIRELPVVHVSVYFNRMQKLVEAGQPHRLISCCMEFRHSTPF